MSQYLTEKKKPVFQYTDFLANTLSKVYPFVSLETIGYSWAGRNLYALTIGNRDNRVLYTAATHGSEWLTTLVLYRFLEDLCRHYRAGTAFSSIRLDSLLEEKGATFIPVMNPDGVEINLMGYMGAGSFDTLVESIAKDSTSTWNANARGVDLNHNFDARWEDLKQMEQEKGITAPAPRQYGGPSPESELESYALAKYCREHYFSSAFALHSQGEEIYYKFEDYDPPKAELMAKVLSASSGYALVQQEGLASYGGFKDWFIKTFCRPAFTIEIGRGENPLALDLLDQVYQQVYEMLLLGMLF